MNTTVSRKYPLTWELEGLLPHPETAEFEQVFTKCRRDLEQLAESASRLPAVDGRGEVAAGWVDFVDQFQDVMARHEDLGSFIACQAAADAENTLFQQFEAQLSALEPLVEQTATNLEYALKAATDEQLAAFTQADPRLAEIDFFLRDRRRHAEVRLPREQELLSAELAVDGLHGWGRLYDRLSGALRVRVMERGELVEKSVGQVQFDSPQRTVRENNFFASNAAWETIAVPCAEALNHIAGTRLTVYRHLGSIDHLELPCRLNRMQRRTLDAMWLAVSQRRACLRPYLEKKAQAYGLPALAWYDLSAPYPGGSTAPSEIPYDQACDLVIRTFHGFSPDLGDFARRCIEQRWVEVENRPGKRQGGFCTDFPDRRQSRIFMTFTDSADSMSTLAHELGHAYHSYVLRDRPFVLQRYPMNLAETASTFAEAVLGEQRLRESESAARQLEILDVMLSDAVIFLMNIHSRFLFEDNFYRKRPDGELTPEQLSELMLDAQYEAFENSLAPDGWNPSFWISKLHFYISEWPFYNFPYTFGYLLSLGIYALGAEGMSDFPDRYRQLLVATGCQPTEQAVQSTLGYDLTDTAFWHKSLDIVERRVERFIELA